MVWSGRFQVNAKGRPIPKSRQEGVGEASAGENCGNVMPPSRRLCVWRPAYTAAGKIPAANSRPEAGVTRFKSRLNRVQSATGFCVGVRSTNSKAGSAGIYHPEPALKLCHRSAIGLAAPNCAAGFRIGLNRHGSSFSNLVFYRGLSFTVGAA